MYCGGDMVCPNPAWEGLIMEKAHVCSTYQVEYGSESFAGGQEVINGFLYEHEALWCYDPDSPWFSVHIEISRERLSELVDEIKSDPSSTEVFLEEHEGNWKASDLLDVFQKWLKEADPRNEYIAVDWF